MTAASVSGSVIPLPLTGQKFLSSSHYKISHDDRFIPDSLLSSFHHDFNPSQSNGKPLASVPLKAAEFEHQDKSQINIKVSETRHEFPAKQSVLDDPRDKYTALYKTNFQMNSDERVKTFNTTHENYYKPQGISIPPLSSQLSRIWTKSNFPQGDKGKAEKPVSSYRSGFEGHKISGKKEKLVLPGLEQQRTTILGDELKRFETSYDKSFDGIPVEPPLPVPKQRISSIPEGDKGKIIESTTTMRRNFDEKPNHYVPYDKLKSMSALHNTNFKLTDKENQEYLSIQEDSFRPVSLSYSDLTPTRQAKHRNSSDLPQGDTDIDRAKLRINSTVHRSHFPAKDPRRAFSERVDGSKLRTISNVTFGGRNLRSSFYDTTCDSTYKTVSVPMTRADSYRATSVPLKYYEGLKAMPTTWTDFPPQKLKILKPLPSAVRNLKFQHFSPPLGQQQFFGTTHDRDYSSKQVEKIKVDPHRLHRSSLPIGTFNKSNSQLA